MMRYAVVSDIHANLQAWDAVLLDIREQDVDCIICLGDVVGYGPNPVEVLESVHCNVDYIILGNHDAAVCDKMSASLFNDAAAEIINWTKNALNKNAPSLFKKLPLSLTGKNFRCCHGAFVVPGKFDYIFTEEDALESFEAVPEQLLFCGHTHLPCLFVLGNSGIPHYLDSQDFKLENSKRYIVNVGSVGNPRTGAPKSTYCIYDADENDIFWRNVSFDLYAYKQALVAKGLPVETSGFLNFDSRIEHPPIREQISFSPPKQLSRKMQQTLNVKDINQLKTKIRIWKFFSIVLLLLMLISTMAIPLMLKNNNKLIVGSKYFIPINATSAQFDKNLLPPFESATNEFTANMQIVLADKEFLKFSFFNLDDLNGIKLESDKNDANIKIIFPPLNNIKNGTKFCIEGFFKKSNDFKGDIYLQILINRKGTRSFETLFTKPPNPNLIRKGGWSVAKRTFTVNDDIDKMQCVLLGTFEGCVEIGKIELYKLPVNN